MSIFRIAISVPSLNIYNAKYLKDLDIFDWNSLKRIFKQLKSNTGSNYEIVSEDLKFISNLQIPKNSQNIDYRYGLLRMESINLNSSKEDFAFVSGYTDLSYGVVHLYRTQNHGQPASGIVAVIAVPSHMSVSEFLKFTASFRSSISHYRIIRDQQPNKYMVLLKFRSLEDSAEFVEHYDSKRFSSMQPEVCHCVHVQSVEFTSNNAGSTMDIEIPTCPVCLERMDASISGIVTILCHHTFHCECLSKWGSPTCPICRYTQRNLDSATASNGGSESVCQECETTQDLWICLICGNVGCGRYKHGHAHSHFINTSHLYALELETQRVWDYAGDGYVHRLIRNKADGKVVELPPNIDGTSIQGFNTQHQNEQLNTGSIGDEHSVKADQILGLEYSQILSISLESQRQYYDELLETKDKEREKVEIRCAELKKRIKSLENALSEEQAISEAMKNTQQLWIEKSKQQQASIKDLEEQVKDLMLFLETRDNIAKLSIEDQQEISDGKIELKQSGSSKRKARQKKR